MEPTREAARAAIHQPVASGQSVDVAGGQLIYGSIVDVQERRSVWFELFYDLVVVTALVNGCRLVEGSPSNVGQLLGPDAGLGVWLGATLAVVIVLWMLTTLYVNVYRNDDWTARSLILIQMFSIAIAILAIGGKGASLENRIGFGALGVAFLSISLLYGLADRARDRGEAVLVMWATGLAGVIFLAGVPLSDRDPWINGLVFAAGALACGVPVWWTLLGRIAKKRLVDVAHFSQRLGELLLIALSESFVEVVMSLDGFTRIPNPPVLVVALLIPFFTGAIYFTAIASRRPPRGVGVLRLWFLAHYLLIFGLMALTTRLGVLVVKPWHQTFSISWFWSVVPLLYVIAALVGLQHISRRYTGAPAASDG